MPLLFAHRGASADAPENTIAAFNLARTQKADGIELDVQLSRDKVPVVIHDDTVDRTTNGHGAVQNMTILELKQLDAGSWKGDRFREEKIPTLADVLDVLSDWLKPAGSARGGILNIELKSEGLLTDGLEKVVVNLIANRDIQSRIIISSFSPFVLYRTKLLNPQLPRGLLYCQDMPIYLRRAWLRPLVKPQFLHPANDMVDTDYMRWASSHKYPVNPWTVDDPSEAKRLAALGVNAIITNQPATLRRGLG